MKRPPSRAHADRTQQGLVLHEETSAAADNIDTVGAQCSDQGVWSSVEAARVLLHQDDKARVTLRQGTCVLVPYSLYERPKTLAVARIEAILQDSSGRVQLALRFAWMAGEIVDLISLTCPRVTPRYPRQVFWQQDACADGACHVKGPDGWMEIQPLSGVSAVCTVLHRSQLTPATQQAAATPARGGEQGPRGARALLLLHAGPMPFLDLFCGMGAVSRAAQDLSKSAQAARAGQPRSTSDSQGFKVLGGVDKEPDAHNAYLGNMMGTSNSIAINRAISLAEFNAGEQLPAKTVQACMDVAVIKFDFSRGIVSQRETGQAPDWAQPGGSAFEPGEVGCMHASPPCQGITVLNNRRNSESLSAPDGLFPLLAEYLVKTVELLQPAFFTLEEVPSFLAISAKSTDGGWEIARCVWAIVLPLLDLGYQLDVRVMNAANYGTPQSRLRVILFAAKPGYRLCHPPKPWNHHTWTYKGLPSLGEDAALLNCQDNRWRHIALTSDDQAEKLPPALSAKDAIDDLPADVTAGSKDRVMAYPSGSAGDFARFLRSGQVCLSLHWLGPHVRIARQYMQQLHERAHYGQPFPVITGRLDAGSARSALCPRPGSQRLLTLAERARLQGLPDSLKPYGSTEAKLAQQIGNAVPYPMAWAILGSVYEAAYGKASPLPPYLQSNACSRSRVVCETPAQESIFEASCAQADNGKGASILQHTSRPVAQTKAAAADSHAHPAALLVMPSTEIEEVAATEVEDEVSDDMSAEHKKQRRSAEEEVCKATAAAGSDASTAYVSALSESV
ncbi:S-adenosyl-L-methionine-dependent methyltransferase [Coccomyxa subellipsoidea C-169]|uniref:DNA (cytosine-5-)-methyltransferase n=1 Tax=Coccomyxa subellipsoidea (strain C-169) TaxID=574566 RepID=I0ZAT7_COCSC|nr:S-adenosyl-L-methionine-dependent methyltransferase [Coccomyxa subellipsoidea C-169]EIE27756.1 S-adenosyl-L-methionine-dependent methyltransferase [Coccomyxa subellipsoidea C-169]|eukprot:XP_005652300.1 S-adenosyl-L-methionine-dependent methyltransferase [Coccomyxa subellipsoidea C-169]